jgi:hypothetical protein
MSTTTITSSAGHGVSAGEFVTIFRGRRRFLPAPLMRVVAATATTMTVERVYRWWEVPRALAIVAGAFAILAVELVVAFLI